MQSLATGLPTSNEPAAEKTSTENQENVVFGLPVVTNTAGKLKERHILWTPVVSAGEKLPLPLDSCCSVSFVSRSHADYVASKRPHSKYQSLETPVTVSVADSISQLKAVGHAFWYQVLALKKGYSLLLVNTPFQGIRGLKTCSYWS